MCFSFKNVGLSRRKAKSLGYLFHFFKRVGAALEHTVGSPHLGSIGIFEVGHAVSAGFGFDENFDALVFLVFDDEMFRAVGQGLGLGIRP